MAAARINRMKTRVAKSWAARQIQADPRECQCLACTLKRTLRAGRPAGAVAACRGGRGGAAMTQAQLDALAALVSMRTGPSLLAAGLVLVEGRRPADAAREAGLSPQAVSNALARLRRALDLARQAVGADSAP